MNSRAIVLLLAGVVLLAAACFLFLGVCGSAATCAPSTLQIVWLAGNGTVSETLIALALIAWLVRTAVLVHATHATVSRLPTTAIPSRLLAGQRRTGVLRLVCLQGDRESAFCSGTWGPTVYIGERVADQLIDDELDAVLLHEFDHARRYEPLRRAARSAAVDVLFFAPVLGWWADRRSVQVELSADRAALQRVGPRAVAGALWTLGGSMQPGAAAFFGGAAEVRVAQLLGDSTAQPGPPRRTVAASAIGTYLSLQVLACAIAPLLYFK